MMVPVRSKAAIRHNEPPAGPVRGLALDQPAQRGGLVRASKQTTAGLPEVAWRYLPFVARASTLLASSLEVGRTLRRAVRLPLPELGTWSALHLLDENGALRFAVAAHAESTVEAAATALWQQAFACDADVRISLGRVLGTGEPAIALASARPSAGLDDQVPALAMLLELLDLRSLLVVPLQLRGHGIGVMTFGSPAIRTYYAASMVAVARAYAQHVAAGLDRARTLTGLRESLHARSLLMASSVHDLRSPLTVIKARVQTLMRSLARSAELQPARARSLGEGLAAIDAAATGLAEIIDGLLELACDEGGAAPILQRRQHDLMALIRRLAMTYHQIAPRQQIVIVAPGIERLDGTFDAGKVSRALGNLLDNAIKYSPPGGKVTIEVARAECSGSDSSDTTASALIRVCDQGIGIPEAELTTIFRPFARAGNVRNLLPGTGVGLSGARQIIELHGGTISVDSSLGIGSTFTVRLPLNPPEEATMPHVARVRVAKQRQARAPGFLPGLLNADAVPSVALTPSVSAASHLD